MEKLTMHSVDGVAQNVERIAALFPNCVTERKGKDGEVERAIDFDMLRQELSRDIIDTGEERYQFTWPGKREAIRLANSPIAAALRPIRKDSVDFDTTQNLYIEGDNLDVLKLLRENYLGKVKMIYIDPPYNTGNDFVYEDDFSQATGDYLANSGQFDDQGNRLVANTESNGRFHTDWLNMIYPRLKVARDLLTDDGVIFISIDDNEVENLKKICSEIFGESNFKSQIVWQKRYTRSNNTIDFTTVVEHILVYSKTDQFVVNLLPRTDEADNRYTNPDNDPRGPWKGASFLNPATPSQRPNLCYPITNPNTGETTYNTDHAWRRAKEVFEQLQAENKLYWGIDGKSKVPSIKMFLSEARGLTPINFWDHEYAGNTDNGSTELFDLMKTKVFDFPKPVKLIKRVLEHASNKDSIVLDFFSGSATTAHAVMQLNAEDDGNRKFIMVQVPETIPIESEACKAGYTNICEIGKERIRRAGKRIKSELEQKANSLSREIDRMLHAKPSTTAQMLLKDQLKEIAENIYKEQILPKQKELDEVERQLETLDIGFRVLRLDSSNMEDVFYTPDKFDAANLFTMTDNVKADRSEEDLLFQVMLELDVPLSATIKCEQIAGKKVFVVANGHLIATFDREVNETTVTEIAKQKPNFFVMRDASAANDNVLDNFEQIFRHYSPDSICKIL